MIVDDDTKNIFALSAVLRSKGYECVTATSAEEAFEALQAHTAIGIVLLDMMMPEMDGYETMKVLRENEHATLPVIAVTAQAMTGDREKCLAAGASDYLSKPIDVDRLFGLLNKYLK